MIRKITLGMGVVLASMLLFGCTTDDTTSTIDTSTLDTTSTTDTTTSTLVTKYIPDEGRLLASQCSQCHGTNGVSTNSWDSIVGEDNFHDEMFEDDAPIMLAQARGYSDSEITLIETYLTQFQEVDENQNEYDDDDNDNYENEDEDD